MGTPKAKSIPQGLLAEACLPLQAAGHALLHGLPTEPAARGLEPWALETLQRLIETVFRPLTKHSKESWDKTPMGAGKAVGILLRFLDWIEHDLPPDSVGMERELEGQMIRGYDTATIRANLAKSTGIQTETDDGLKEAFRAQSVRTLETFFAKLSETEQRWKNAPPPEKALYLEGIQEGYAMFLTPQGEYAGSTQRTEIYLLLLTYRIAIRDKLRAEPNWTRTQLYRWLRDKHQWPKRGQKWFNEICDEIGLKVCAKGHHVLRRDDSKD